MTAEHTHSLVGLRLTLAKWPLQLAPAWALLAGWWLGQPTFDMTMFVRLVLALALVDPLWGALQNQFGTQRRSPATPRTAAAPALPYARPESPSARLWAWLRDPETANSRSAIGILLIAMALSLFLGPAAVLATTIAALLAFVGVIIRPAFARLPRLLAAFTGIALTWWLGFQLGQTGQPVSLWPSASDAALWVLVLAFTASAFGEVEFEKTGAHLWLWVGHTAVILTLALAGAWWGVLICGIILLYISARVGHIPQRRAQTGQWLALLLATLFIQ